MKKFRYLIPVLIFFFGATATSYAGFFTNQPETNDSYSSSNNYSGGEANEGNSGFFRSSSADNPGGRPGNGDGIGQDAPVGDGIPVVLACCIALVLLKFFDGKKKKRRSGK